MARIRTIKPEFWTDEKLTECSLPARLLFIGLLNFADDNGNLTRSSKKIKMQVFPADSIDCEPLLAEMFAHGVLREYSVSGDKYINIKGFNKHQLINRPSATSIPKYEFNEDSVSTHGGLTDGEEGKGEEGKGKERKEQGETPTSKPKSKKTSLPADFAVSESVKSWAIEKGHANLDAHLESFKLKAAAAGYQYVNWDSAFMGAIRDNWAKVPAVTSAKSADSWQGRDF